MLSRSGCVFGLYEQFDFSVGPGTFIRFPSIHSLYYYLVIVLNFLFHDVRVRKYRDQGLQLTVCRPDNTILTTRRNIVALLLDPNCLSASQKYFQTRRAAYISTCYLTG